MPGQFSTDDWFNRFTGKFQLTKLPVGLSSVASSSVKMEEGKIPFEVEKETQFYVKRRGVYTCKLCDIYRSGSIESMNNHLCEIHLIPREELVKSPVQVSKNEELIVEKTNQDEVKVVRTLTEFVESPQEEVEVSTQISASPQPEEPPRIEQSEEVSSGVEENVFKCPVCSRPFSSERGLNLHMSRSHGTTEESSE